MLWQIELKFCIWLFIWWTSDISRVSSIFVNFVGVMPLLELRILEIHSFPHFSATCTCFDILSWNLIYDFDFMNFRYSDCHHLGSSLKELCPLSMYSFAHFSCSCFEFLILLYFLHIIILVKYDNHLELSWRAYYAPFAMLKMIYTYQKF